MDRDKPLLLPAASQSGQGAKCDRPPDCGPQPGPRHPEGWSKRDMALVPPSQ
jgi:hypothetical protein